MAIIYIYDSTATDFTYNGQPLNKAYEAVVDNMINDSFFVTFNHPLDDKGIYKNIEKDKIVKVHTPDGMQPFRIMDRVKYMDHISIEAWPLFYADMRNKLVKPLAIRGLSGQAAVSAFVSNLLIDTPFTFTSNIIDTHDYHTQDTEERENNPNQLYNALDVFKDIVTRWQGELVINGYDIRMVSRLGKNTGALLYEKKNISDFTDEESIQDVTTRLYGKSEWTERPEGSDQEIKHKISVKVESPLIDAYGGVVFEKQYTNNNIRTEKEMTDWLNLKFTTDNIDKPSRNIKVGTNIVDNTVINIGDSLVLKYVKHDVDMEIRMVGYTYDGYADRYITIQLGDAKQSYVGNVQNTVRELETNVNTSVKQNVNQILNANGERLIYSDIEPVGNFRNGDVWYDEQGGMYFWDEASGMWIDHPYNRNLHVMAEQVGKAVSSAEEAKSLAISEAEEALSQAKADATTKANAVKEQISGEVNTAISTAEDAKALAISEAENALALAKADATTKVNAIHEQISGEVNTAISTAEDAKALAVSEAENALALAKLDATAKANAVKTEVSNSVNTAIETANDAKQTAIDNYNNAVAEATRLDGEQTTAFDTKFGEIEGNVDAVSQSVSDADAKAEAIKQGLGLSDITLTNQQITDQIRSDYDTVKQNANNALTDAGKAIIDAQNAQRDADKVIEDFETFLTSDFASAENDIITVKQNANNALTNAGKALTDAYNAQQDADKIIEDFETFLTSDFASAESDIVDAQTTATDALSKAGIAVSDLGTFKNDYNTFITNQFNPAFTTATNALSLAEQNEGLFYSANLIDEVTGQSNVYTKAEIDGTNGYVTKSTFKQNADTVSSELERVEGVALATGANINLLVRKDEQSGKYLDTGGVIKGNADYAISTHKINVTSGEKLTFSQIFARNFRYAFYKSDGTFLSFGMSASQKFTITVPMNASYMLPSYSTTENYPKIERGEVKTQWTLAPQDQVNQTTVNYLTSQIEQTAGKISEALTAYTPTNSLDDTVSSYLNNQSTKTAGAIDTKLTSYAKTTDLNGLATETFATNKATETAEGVKKELVEVIGTKVDEDTLDGYVSTATYDEGVKGISRSISTVEGKIPNFIGGKNLIPKSNEIKLIDYPNNQVETYANGFTKFLTSTIASEVYTNKTYPIKPSTTYTASATVRTDGTMTNIGWNFYTTEVGSNIVTAKFKKLGTNTYRIFATVTTRTQDANLRFPDITPIGIANATYYEIGEYQLELGSIATDWGLAISDMQTVASLDGNVKSLFTNTSSETSKEIVRTLSAYTPTNSLDSTVATYLTNKSSATAGAIENKLTSYAKSIDLNGLATETYATNVAVSEAGKVSNELTKYAKSTDLTGLATEEYAQTQATTEAGKVEQKLTGYAKSTDLTGLATETYATNKAIAEAGKVSNELTKYELKTGVDSKVSTLATTLRTETADKMRTVYTKTETETLLGNKADISTLNNYVQQATYESGIDGVSQNLIRVEGKVDGLQIGGRNLIKGTHSELKQYTKESWNFKENRINASELNYYGIGVGTKLTYRVYIDKPSEDVSSHIQFVKKPTAYVSYRGNFIKAGESGYSTVSIEVSDADLTQIDYVRVMVTGTLSAQTTNLSKEKLEIGSTPTDWTPAPEDNLSQSDFKIFENSYSEDVKGINSKLVAVENNISDANNAFTSFKENEYKRTAERVSDTFTKSETNTLIGSKADKTQLTNYLAKSTYEQDATQSNLRFETIETNKADTTYVNSEVKNSADAIKTTLTSYAKSTDLNGLATETYATNVAVSEAEKVSNELTKYAKSTDLTGLATETYASNVAVSEAGKVEQKLTNYQTTSGLDTSVKALFTNTNSQTANYIDNKLSAYTSNEAFNSKTQSYLTNNQYQTAGQVATTLNAYTKTDNLDGTVSGYLNNSNSQTASAINTKLTDYQTTASLDANVANLFTNTNSATAKKIDSSLTAIKGLIPTTIDNQNMLDGTSEVWLQGDVSNSWNMYAYSGPTVKIPALPNSTYIVSADVIKEYNDVGLFIFEYQNSTLIKENYVTGLWRYPTDRVRRSFKIKTGANTNNIAVGFRFNASNIQTKFKYRRVQLEHSEIETDWKPSFKDTVALSDYTIFKNDTTDTAALHAKKLSSITAEGIVTSSNVNQTADGITQRVAKVDADGNVVYANTDIKLDSIVSTVANGTYISNLIQTSNLLQSTITSFAPNQNILKGTDFANEENTMGDVIEYGRKPKFSKADYFSYGRIATIAIPETSGDANLGFAVKLPTKDKWYTLSFYGLANWLGTAGVDFYVTDPYKTLKNYKATLLPEYDLATYRIQVTVKATVANAMIYARPQGNRFNANYNNIVFWGVKLEGGEVATKWGDNVSSSKITQLENNINLKVSDEKLLTRINVRAGAALIQSGTNKLNVTPETTFIADATIKSAMIDTVNVKQLTGITADFTSMVTKALTANTITSTMINANDAMFSKLFATSMATDKLVAQGAWITDANIVSLDAGTITSGTIDTGRLDAGAIVTGGLSANVVKSTHIESSTGLIDKIFANEALITRLTSNTIFASKIKAIEIDASKITSGQIATARLDAKTIVTSGLDADVVKATHIQSSIGLIDKIFADEASITRLTSNLIFASKIKAIEIDASKITSGTIDSALIDAEYIVTNGLSTNVVESKHIKAETGLVDKIFSKTAYIEELTNKTVFTEKIQAININADKITTGTLDASKVSVVNLDANNITANTTSFVQSAWNGINNTISIDGNGIRSANTNGDWTLYHSGAISFGNNVSQGIYLEYADGARNGLAIHNRGALNSEITLDLISSARNTLNFGRRTDTNGYDFRIDHYQGTKVSFDGRGVQRYTFNVNSDAQSHAISILGHGATSGYNSGSGLSIGLETADGMAKGSRFYFSSTSDLVWLGKNSYSDLKPLAVFDLQFRWGQNGRKSMKTVLEYLSRASGVDINNIPDV
ncbi:hypothetical protein [Aerococcus urinaeequi]|uniref:hypothetical protein n=1 Tax=Aerococcus urinaeequi TaxID=51665 RepID=UPI003D6AB3A3